MKRRSWRASTRLETDGGSGRQKAAQGGTGWRHALPDVRHARLRRVSRALPRGWARATVEGRIPRAVFRVEGKGRALLLAITEGSRFGIAWVALCVAFAIHVADEALTDFLSVYNPTVRAIRARFPILLLPTFTFRVWLTGLMLAVVVLASLTPFAFRGAGWMRPVALAFGLIMAGNGLLHLVGSLYMKKAMPGVYSAPLILGAAVYLLASVP